MNMVESRPKTKNEIDYIFSQYKLIVQDVTTWNTFNINPSTSRRQDKYQL